MPLRPFIQVPKDLREWSRWCREQNIAPDEDTIESTALKDGAVTYAKIQDVTADRVLGRLTTGGDVSELTAAQLATLLQAAIEALNLAFSGNIGFHGESATAQQSDPGAPTITSVSGSGDDITINENFQQLETALNGIRTALNTKGLTG